MSEKIGEFKKRIKAFRNNTTRLRVFSDEEATMIQDSIVLLIDEMKQDLFDCFRRGLIHTGLVKWFGDEDSKPSHVYSELELKKMAHGIPIDTKEPSKNE